MWSECHLVRMIRYCSLCGFALKCISLARQLQVGPPTSTLVLKGRGKKKSSSFQLHEEFKNSLRFRPSSHPFPFMFSHLLTLRLLWQTSRL